jgi:hypothetical protein
VVLGSGSELVGISGIDSVTYFAAFGDLQGMLEIVLHVLLCVIQWCVSLLYSAACRNHACYLQIGASSHEVRSMALQMIPVVFQRHPPASAADVSAFVGASSNSTLSDPSFPEILLCGRLPDTYHLNQVCDRLPVCCP